MLAGCSKKCLLWKDVLLLSELVTRAVMAHPAPAACSAACVT